MLPGAYSHVERYHCTFCGEELDHYRDFNGDGTFKNDDYLCQGCANAPSYARPYLPEAVAYLTRRLLDRTLPPHIRWTYEQHLQSFNARNMVS
jgi:hypothetical protein